MGKEEKIQITVKIRVKDMFYFMMYHTYYSMDSDSQLIV